MDWGQGLLGGRPQREVPVHPVRPRCLPSTRPVTAHIGRGHLEVGLPGVPTPRGSFPFPHCPLGKGVATHSPPKEWGGALCSPRTAQLCRRCGILLRRRRSIPFLYQCMSESLTDVSMDSRYLSYSVGYSPTRLHSVAGTGPAPATGSPCSWLLCPSDMPIKVGAVLWF